MSHRDVVREADGLGMMSMWRINMLRFWGGGKWKYLISGHRLLAGKKLNCTTAFFNYVCIFQYSVI
jgi:hypothetical protein